MVMSTTDGDSNLIASDDSDGEEDEMKKGMPQSVWYDVVDKSSKKKHMQERWQRMTNTVRYRVKYTKAFEEINQGLVNDKHNRGGLSTNLAVQCLLEQEIDAEALRRRQLQQKQVRGSSTMNQGRGKWLLKYFIALSEITDPDQKKVDYEHLEMMIASGVDVNCVDKHGQCVMHEVARIWHTDVARFFLQHGKGISCFE